MLTAGITMTKTTKLAYLMSGRPANVVPACGISTCIRWLDLRLLYLRGPRRQSSFATTLGSNGCHTASSHVPRLHWLYAATGIYCCVQDQAILIKYEGQLRSPSMKRGSAEPNERINSYYYYPNGKIYPLSPANTSYA